MLSPILSQKIIQDVKKLIDEDILIAGTDGIITASSDEKRVGAFHEGALLCAAERRTLVLYKEDEKRLKGVKNGLNLPIFFMSRVIGVIGITGHPETILPYGELLRKMTELLVQEGYMAEQAQWQARSLESFVYDWLHTAALTPELKKRADALQVDLAKSKQFVLIEASFTSRSIQEMNRFWDDARGLDFFVYQGHERILLIHSVHDNASILPYKLNRLQHFMEEARLGAGQPVLPDNAAEGFAQAERALSAAPPNHIVFEEELRLSLCLQDIHPKTRKEFVHRLIGEATGQNELIGTLRTFFDQNMSLKQTAEAMNIHINTLHYRLKKWQRLTGQDVRITEDAVSTYLALRFLDESLKS
ncbi:helix-turn-helix domain-containing protein [Domibacillus indicus]|uniref:CdaR family transcriptional regulator n=1 Tax=Domibacillus indicus TaxID=1437523 RepID=UPI00203C572E|nr:sugar diacid recognition domain-containing protein [Domibacillus indicus]MCM3787212.1 helix-turn-helix domain-containing protein [Domibacillus indicus]